MTNALHVLFRDPSSSSSEQLRLIAEQPELLEQEDDSWEGWLPLHNAARWGASFEAVQAALAAFPEAAKVGSKGGYEALHLASMGGHLEAVRAIVGSYPEGALKKDNNGRTPLDEAREGSSPSHEAIVAALLALPGVREADAAEQQLRAQHAEALMLPDCDDDGNYREDTSVARSVVGSFGALAAGGGREEGAGADKADGGADIDDADDADDAGFGVTSTALSLANRMFRAASNALWRSEEAAPEQSAAELAAFFTERAKYIPLRLELRERSYLRLLEGMLKVCEYTARVDSAAMAAAPAKRQQTMHRELHAVLSGLLLSCDYEAGQHAMGERAFDDFPDFFAPLFEVTRRYKIMNPEKMRDTYGKMIYLLQDANSEAMREELGFSLVAPIQTVHAKLKACDALALLQDEQMATATQVVTPEPGKSRYTIQREIKRKEAAIESLARRYRSSKLPEEELRQCLYSISDNNAYLYQVAAARSGCAPDCAPDCLPLPGGGRTIGLRS